VSFRVPGAVFGLLAAALFIGAEFVIVLLLLTDGRRRSVIVGFRLKPEGDEAT
jgi:hypothetical protein